VRCGDSGGFTGEPPGRNAVRVLCYVGGLVGTEPEILLDRLRKMP
jgi:hypothetical protein